MTDTNSPVSVGSAAYVQISSESAATVENVGAYGVYLVVAAAQPAATTIGHACTHGNPYSMSGLTNPIWAKAWDSETQLVVLD